MQWPEVRHESLVITSQPVGTNLLADAQRHIGEVLATSKHVLHNKVQVITNNCFVIWAIGTWYEAASRVRQSVQLKCSLGILEHP